LEALPPYRHTRNRSPLAPDWFSNVLAADFQSPEARRKKTGTEGGSGIDLPYTHGELLMLGFDLSERTISRWMKRAPRDPDRAKRWLTFTTIGKPLEPWISLLCQRLPSAYSTASSSSAMIGGASCTLTSNNMRGTRD
jgi:hypothetical protein